jgi:hypothetical protein
VLAKQKLFDLLSQYRILEKDMRNTWVWILALLAISVSVIIFLIVRPTAPVEPTATSAEGASMSSPNDKCITRFYELPVGEREACIAAFDDSRCAADRASLHPVEARWCALGQGRIANQLKARCAALQTKVDAGKKTGPLARGEDPLPAALRAEVDAFPADAKHLGRPQIGCTLLGDERGY